MKIATWNVNGIRARQEQVVAFAASEQPDVLCLQEIKAAADHIPGSVCELPGYWCYWHGTKGYSGVALLVRKEVEADRPIYVHPDFDLETRIAVARVGGILIASIYVPNGGKNFVAKMRFLEAMAAYVRGLRAIGDKVVLCGDINIARSEMDVHPRERNDRVVGQRSDERAMFEHILEVGGLHDVARERDPTNDGLFTWWAPWRNMSDRVGRRQASPAGAHRGRVWEPSEGSQKERNIGWRLDYVLATGGLAAAATDCVSMRQFGTSDYAPVVATFNLTRNPERVPHLPRGAAAAKPPSPNALLGQG